MSDYTKALNGLRHCINLDGLEPNDPRIRCHGCPYFTEPTRCGGILMRDAAAAIEELQQIADHHEQTAKDYWKEACEYKAQLPKRGEWVKGPDGLYHCSTCGATAPYLDAFDGVIQYWENLFYCNNCGAKMEAQDGQA